MGNSRIVKCMRCLHSVHPHVHGELKATLRYRRIRTGSSPRAWGTLWISYIVGIIERFIPTCMGNSAVEEVDD